MIGHILRLTGVYFNGCDREFKRDEEDGYIFPLYEVMGWLRSWKLRLKPVVAC